MIYDSSGEYQKHLIEFAKILIQSELGESSSTKLTFYKHITVSDKVHFFLYTEEEQPTSLWARSQEQHAITYSNILDVLCKIFWTVLFFMYT